MDIHAMDLEYLYDEFDDCSIEDYRSWISVEAVVTFGSGIPRPIAEISADEFLY